MLHCSWHGEAPITGRFPLFTCCTRPLKKQASGGDYVLVTCNGFTSFCTGKVVDYDKICRLLLFPLLCTPLPFPFFISHLSTLSSLYPISLARSLLLLFFLSSIIHHSTSHRISVSMLIDFGGLAMERDIKSGLWLCMCLQPRLWLTGMLIQLSGVFSVFLSSFFLFFSLLRNL